MKLFKKTLITFLLVNNRMSLLYVLLILAPVFYACRERVATESHVPANAVASQYVSGEKYSIDKKASVVIWRNPKLFAEKGGHSGFVSISRGELIMEKENLVGGFVEVDMNTITDEHHQGNNNLVEHLKDADFFDVKKFPTTEFVLTKVEAATDKSINVTGNLTIKGTKHAVTFPADIDVKAGVITANGKLTIDRTQWGVIYKSGKFFFNLADEAISDFIEFEFRIVAKK